MLVVRQRQRCRCSAVCGCSCERSCARDPLCLQPDASGVDDDIIGVMNDEQGERSLSSGRIGGDWSLLVTGGGLRLSIA